MKNKCYWINNVIYIFTLKASCLANYLSDVEEVWARNLLHMDIHVFQKKREGKYSKTPLLRPPLGLRKNGLDSGVVLLLS